MNVPAREVGTGPASTGSVTDPNAPTEAAGPVVVSPPSTDELVAAAVDAWRTRLVEAAGGSSLSDVELLADAALDLSAAHPSGVAQLFAGRPTRLSNLVREGAARSTAKRRARAVGQRSDAFAQQYGIAPTFLAIGVATWVERIPAQPGTDDVAALASATRGPAARAETAAPGADEPEVAPETDVPGAGSSADAGAPVPRTVRAPVLLRPVSVHARGSGEPDYELTLESSLEVNPVLARALRGHGALLDPVALARGAFTGTGFDPRSALDRLEALGKAVLDSFVLTERLVVGSFVHPGQILVDDLDELSSTLDRNEVIAALAGDDDARAVLARPLPEAAPGDRDPDEERGVGDLGPAQHRALDLVATGAHLFVDAPAGADTTGTVAAIVADAAASGRDVLYVPGHRRAATALVDRLERLGLGDLVLDVAPEPGWRSTVSRRLLGAMTLEPVHVDAAGVRAVRRELVEHREQLRGYVDALHAPREPWSVSAYDALQALAHLTSARPAPRTTVRLAEDVARTLAVDERAALAAELVRAGEVGAFSLRPADTPWFGADIDTPAAAADALDRLDRLTAESLPQLVERVKQVADQTGLLPARSVAAWGEQLGMLDGIRGALDVFQPMIFERTAADMVAATATRQWRTEQDVQMSGTLRRRLAKQAKDMLRPGRPVDDLNGALIEVQRQREIWQAHCPAGGWPRLPENLARIAQEQRTVRDDLTELDRVLAGTPHGGGLLEEPFTSLVERLERLRTNRDALGSLPERTALTRTLAAAGLGELVEDLRSRRVAAALAPAELELAWWSGVFEAILRSEPRLAGYDGARLGELARSFGAADLAHVASLSAPVLAAVVGQASASMRAQRSQAEALFAELVEERITSLRDTMSRFGDLVRRLRPVVTASPMLVPQVMPATRTVDLVVLDAAGHLELETVLPAIARARQVVVVGDSRCASGSAVRALAEILPATPLHDDVTRRDPYLTAFLAEHGYAGLLEAVPLPEVEPLVHLDVVDGSGMPDAATGSVASTRAEVEHTVELAITHALTRPTESLAVVTVSPVHAERVREALLAEVRVNPSLAAFFDSGRAEPAIVTDLGGVAGLRRDAIILSVGFGRTPHGRVLHSFGPLTGAGGAALLTDAVGATRHRLTVVSCFAAGDLDPERLRGPGSRLLRDLLAFAEQRAGLAPQHRGTTAPLERDLGAEPDRLVVDLAERLWRTGLRVEINHGVPGGVRLPLAVGHPDVKDRLLVAVLTDDDAYVSEPSVRVRDRQVAGRLENLGWSVVRVWSAAAFLDPQAEADAISALVTTRAHALLAAAPATPLTPPDPSTMVRKPSVPSANTSVPSPNTSVPSARTPVPSGQPSALSPDEPDARPGPLQSADAVVAADARPVGVEAEPRLETKPVVIPNLAGHDQQMLDLPERSGSRPQVAGGLPIGSYGEDQLDALVAWICSDGIVRDDAEVAAELRAELAVARRGKKVDAVVAAAVRRRTH